MNDIDDLMNYVKSRDNTMFDQLNEIKKQDARILEAIEGRRVLRRERYDLHGHKLDVIEDMLRDQLRKRFIIRFKMDKNQRLELMLKIITGCVILATLKELFF